MGYNNSGDLPPGKGLVKDAEPKETDAEHGANVPGRDGPAP